MGVEASDGRGLGRLGAWRLTAQVRLGFDLRERERHGVGIAKFCQRVDPRTAGIAEAEQFCNFVKCLARGVVHRAAHERVFPRSLRRAGQIKVGVPAGDDERQSRVVMQA